MGCLGRNAKIAAHEPHELIRPPLQTNHECTRRAHPQVLRYSLKCRLAFIRPLLGIAFRHVIATWRTLILIYISELRDPIPSKIQDRKKHEQIGNKTRNRQPWQTPAKPMNKKVAPKYMANCANCLYKEGEKVPLQTI